MKATAMWSATFQEHGEPLNLKIEKADAVRWLPGGGLRVESPTRIASTAAAAKVVQAIGRSGELTLEAWVKPANTTQAGPARIVTFSADPSRRNFTLGQAAGDFEVRFRTTTTSANGEPSLWSSSQDADAGPNVSALRSATGDLAVLYFARGGQVTLNRSKLADGLRAEWYNPRDGSSRPAEADHPEHLSRPRRRGLGAAASQAMSRRSSHCQHFPIRWYVVAVDCQIVEHQRKVWQPYPS